MAKFYVINTTRGGGSLNSIVITNGRGISIYSGNIHYTTFSRLDGGYGHVQYGNQDGYVDYYRYYTGYVLGNNRSYTFSVDKASGKGGKSYDYYCNGFIADNVSESPYIDSYPLVNINGRFKVNHTSYSLSKSLSHVLVVCKLAIDSVIYYGFAINGTSVYLLTSNPSTTVPENYSIKSFSSIANDSVIEFENSEVPDFILDYLTHQGDFLYDYNYIVHSYDGQIIASKNEVPEIKHIKFTTLSNFATLIITGTNNKDYELAWTISSPPDGTKFLGLSFVKTSRRPSIPIGYDQDITIDGNLELYEVFGRDYTPTKTFEMNIYKNSAESNRVDKTNQLVFVDTINGVFRESSSIVEPVFNISVNDVPQFNYVYIPAFNRYYFVVELTSMNYNLWRLSLKCDVLMTYKDGIKALNAFVERNESQFDENIVDKLRPIEEGYDVQSTEIPNNLFGNLSIADKYIVVTGAGITIEEEE